METPVIYTETFQEEEEEEEEDSTDDEIDWLEYIYDDDDDEYTTDNSSEEPEYRPPYAGGGNNSSSISDEDSELECPPIHFQVEESDCDESLDWADHEDNITTTIVKQTPTTTPPIENKSLASATPVKFPSGYQRCVGCKYWFKQTTLYCNSCWKMKKDWLPDPPPPKSKLSRSKIKTARQKRTKQRGNRSDDTLSRSSSSSSNETEDPISAPRITLCMLCCTNPRNASLIHGQIGHQLCCYPCAKKLWKEQARCPVCRRKIEKVVKLIQN